MARGMRGELLPNGWLFCPRVATCLCLIGCNNPFMFFELFNAQIVSTFIVFSLKKFCVGFTKLKVGVDLQLCDLSNLTRPVHPHQGIANTTRTRHASCKHPQGINFLKHFQFGNFPFDSFSLSFLLLSKDFYF